MTAVLANTETFTPAFNSSTMFRTKAGNMRLPDGEERVRADFALVYHSASELSALITKGQPLLDKTVIAGFSLPLLDVLPNSTLG